MSQEPSLFDVIDDILPVTPYRGTGGSVSRDTSLTRAEHEVKSGKLGARQNAVLKILREVSMTGATWKELGARLNLHHGQISGVLSNLHKDGRVFMLQDTRDGSHPYCHRGIIGNFQWYEIYSTPVKTARTEYIEALFELRLKVLECIDSGFAEKEVRALIEAVRDERKS